MMPSVSVVIAAKNYGRYLPSALDSALAQTRLPDEIIVIDDGSTDNTLLMIRPYLSNPRVKYVPLNGLGVCRARNLGIELSKGELIAFLDADDLWEPTKLERQLPLFADPGVGVVYARRTLIDPNGKPLSSQRSDLHRGELFNVFLRTNPVCFSSAVVRRNVFDHVGLFDPSLSLAVDYDLWLRIAPYHRFDYVDEPMVSYRTGHGNLSSRMAERTETVFHLLRRVLSRRDLPVMPDPESVAEAWGSTCRSMGYATKKRSRMEAAKWYLKAATHDGHWLRSFKSAAGALLKR
ncbi:glycosyltransferase family 2 protein [Zavarzinella formosa]|uniref:glycosyltransferase family 2 protein n=1 Tax=Zavarzinella formosa TaxID=360055 RepID=UPI0002F38FA6|nr:glycosyltransferase family A protein [Zavarzinella formosa]